MSTSPPRRVLIIGGVAGGASCAARLRRLDEHAQITLIERGPHVSFANCGLPYHVGGVIPDAEDLLLVQPEELAARFALDVRTRTTALAIDRVARRLRVRDQAGEEADLPYDQLVLAPGAAPLRPPLPGLDLPGVFTLRTVPDAEAIQRWIEQHDARDAVVVGGGFIGVEMAENLRHRGLETRIVELGRQLMPPFDPECAWAVQERLQAQGVAVDTGCALEGITAEDGRLVVAAGGRTLKTDLVLLALGVRPESDLARDAGLELGPRGHIVVDHQMRSSDPAIFAVGDAVQVFDRRNGQPTALALAGPANRQGRIAAAAICGRDERFAGVQGTSIVGVFGLALAGTGPSEKALRAAGETDLAVAWLHAGNHVGYYPGASEIHLKLLYRPSDGRVLGAQAWGEAGVDRRIDVIAAYLQLGATVEDLAEAELCYAPQFGAAKDLINLAGMVAVNQRSALDPLARWEELSGDQLVLDVRSPAEFAAGHHPRALNIPVEDLRRRHGELPNADPVLVTCGVGKRAHNAVCLLRGMGRDARNLTGGEATRRQLVAAGLMGDPPATPI